MTLIELKRGEIYQIIFPYTFDKRYPNGKEKFVLILQEGEYFNKFSTVTILLLSTNGEAESLDYVVTVEKGTTDLWKKSYVDCSQPYTILKELFVESKIKSFGRLTEEKMNEIDSALYIGLSMGEYI